MEISTWRTEAGDLDFLHDLWVVDGSRLVFTGLTARSTSTTLGGAQIRLASLGDIVASKQFAGRDKDREALPESSGCSPKLRGEPAWVRRESHGGSGLTARGELTLRSKMARADGAKMARDSAGIFRDRAIVGHRRSVRDRSVSSGITALGDP